MFCDSGTANSVVFVSPLAVDFSASSSEYKSMGESAVSRLKTGERLQLSEAESFVTDGKRRVDQKFLQDFINALGRGDVGPALPLADGTILNRKRLRTIIVRTLFGRISITRYGYFAKGHRSRYPLDAYLNLAASSFSHKLRRKVAFEAAKGSFSEVSSSLLDHYGIKIYKEQVELISVTAACDFDDFYTEKLKIPPAATLKSSSILALSLDSKGIVMRKEDLTINTQRALAKEEKTLKHRLTAGEKKNRKRMATAAAVYTIEPFLRTPEEIVSELDHVKENKEKRRPKPQSKRVWARIDASAEAVCDALFLEAKGRDKDCEKNWVVLVDGEKNQIRRIKARIKKYNKKTLLILDIVHVIEYLWRAGRVFFESKHKDCEAWVTSKLLEVLKGNSGYAAAGITRTAKSKKIKKSAKEEIFKVTRYLHNNKKYMAYDKYLKKGLPIATGIIEGVCRYIIKDRMDVTGARWTMRGAEAILKLRSLKASGDFEAYWAFHEQQEYKRYYSDLKIVYSPEKSVDRDRNTEHI